MKFYFKYKNWKLPYYLQSLSFSLNSDIHDHETRIQHNIHELKTRHDYAKRCIRFDLPKVINSTPRQILDKINTHSLQGFSGYIKQHILISYQESYTLQTAIFAIDNSLHFILIEITMIISSEQCVNIEEWTLPVFLKWTESWIC